MDINPFLNKLNGLDTDTLTKIQQHISEILDGRLDTRVVTGREAVFESSNAGTIRCRIEKVNPKTVSVTEISPVAGRQWRVSIAMLKVKPVEKESWIRLSPPVKPIAHKPSTSVDAW